MSIAAVGGDTSAQLTEQLYRLRAEAVLLDAGASPESRQDALGALATWSISHDDRLSLSRYLPDVDAGIWPTTMQGELQFTMGLGLFERALAAEARKDGLSRGLFEESIAHLSAVEGRDLRTLRALFVRAGAHYHLGRKKRAVQDWRDVIQRIDTVPCSSESCRFEILLADLSLLNIAHVYYGLDDLENAKKYYELMPRASQPLPGALLGLATVHLARGDWRAAKRAAGRLQRHSLRSMAQAAEAGMVRVISNAAACRPTRAARHAREFDATWTPVYNSAQKFETLAPDQKIEALIAAPHAQLLPEALWRDLLRSRDLQILRDRLRLLAPLQDPSTRWLYEEHYSAEDLMLLDAETLRAGEWAVELLTRDVSRFITKLETLSAEVVNVETRVRDDAYRRSCRAGVIPTSDANPSAPVDAALEAP